MNKEYRRPAVMRTSSLSFFLMLLVFSSVAFITVNNLAQANALRQTLSTERLQLDQNSLVAQRLSILRQQWHQQQLTDTSIMTKLPSNENLPELLCELSDLADTCSVTIMVLTLTPPIEMEQGRGGRQIKLDLTANGPYDNIKEYLTLLLATERYFTIETVDLTQALSYANEASVSSTDSWTARVNLTAFFLPPFSTTNFDHP